MSEPVVLGIESTCDETAAAIVRGRELLSNVVASSMEEHARYGGVIPEIASRAHAEAFVPCVSKALADANMTLAAAAVTPAPVAAIAASAAAIPLTTRVCAAMTSWPSSLMTSSERVISTSRYGTHHRTLFSKSSPTS